MIFGGGIAGWMSALALRTLQPGAEILLVETPSPRGLGIGEVVGPGFRPLVVRLGMDADRFDRTCSSHIRLATRFDGWQREGSHSWWPFAWRNPRHEQLLRRVLRAARNAETLADLSPHVRLARRGGTPTAAARAALPYGLHFDTGSFVQLARDAAAAKGVRQLFGTINAVRLAADGAIAGVDIGADRIVEADLFVDATGGSLIEELPRGGWRPAFDGGCDRAVGLWLPGDDDAPCISIVRSASHGFFWQTPLAHSVGFGFGYRSGDLDETQAVECLVAAAPLTRRRTADPRRVAYVRGRRDVFWGANWLAVGQAAYCVDPFFASECHVVQRCLEALLDVAAIHPDGAARREAYDRRVAADADAAFDFVQLLYLTSGRDEPFWREARRAALSDRLADLLQTSREHGTLTVDDDDVFGWTAYAHMMVGVPGIAKLPDAGDEGLSAAVEDEAGRVARLVSQWQGAGLAIE